MESMYAKVGRGRLDPATIVSEYAAGKSVVQIAREHACTPQAVYKLLRRINPAIIRQRNRHQY